jgi:hypothetical protein
MTSFEDEYHVQIGFLAKLPWHMGKTTRHVQLFHACCRRHTLLTPEYCVFETGVRKEDNHGQTST